MEHVFQNEVAHKGLSLAIMAGALILFDAAIPGAGLWLAIAVLIVAALRSNITDYLVKLLNYGSSPYMKRGPGSPGSVGG